MLELENIILDESYTAKVMAGMLYDCKTGAIKPTDVVLYWHTYCSNEFADITAKMDMSRLPAEFQKYLQ